MSGGLYDAATLERWNVVNRVLPDAELAEKSLRFAQRLAAGPTRAHHATKRVVRAFLEDGVRGADEATAAIGAPLFETERPAAGGRDVPRRGSRARRPSRAPRPFARRSAAHRW